MDFFEWIKLVDSPEKSELEGFFEW
jgi:hypothetical protein